jgi:anti-sigma regulatory factor (Ser/Thr protein kinase)
VPAIGKIERTGPRAGLVTGTIPSWRRQTLSLGARSPATLIFDMSGVTLTDSSGLRALATELRLMLERDRQAPSLARAAVRRFCEERKLGASEGATLTLLVSELVSNAVRHSDASPASAVLLSVSLGERGELRVEVTDRGNGFSAAVHDPAEGPGGYGLYLVDAHARRWGVDREGGTRVWFEL